MSRKRVPIFCCVVVAAVIASAVWWKERSPFGSGPIDVAELGKFDLDQANGVDADIPRPIRELNGRRITLLGEMWQPMLKEGTDADVEAFDLAKLDHSSSWQSLRVQDFVLCRVPPERKIAYYPNAVQVTGTLQVGIQKDNGRIFTAFTMDVDSVQPTP